MGLTLYQVTTDYLHALSVLDDGDHDPEVVREALDSIMASLEHKAGNVAAYILNIKAEAKALADAEARLKARRQTLEKRAAWLRDYIMTCMQACKVQELRSPDLTIRLKIRLNPESVEVDNPDLLPDEYCRIKTLREPDRKAILEAIRQGADVPGARVVRKHRLEIK